MSNGHLPIYYPASRTNWAGIVAGLAAVGIGSYAVYWLWENGYLDFLLGKECYTSEECPTGYQCVGNKCVSSTACSETNPCPTGYTCVNGYCRQDNLPCTNLHWSCTPGWAGMQRCDYQKNLCRCSNGRWSLIEEQSDICKNSISRLKCFYTENNIALCSRTYETGSNLCTNEGTSYGCPCNATTPIDCSSDMHCCQDGLCYPRAAGYFYATSTNGLTCWSDGTSRYARYDFDSGGISNYRVPVSYHQLQNIKIYLDGTQWGAYGFYFYDGWQWGGWNEVYHPSTTETCLTGCNPLSPGSWNGEMRCMDSFLVGIGSFTGPPNITGISFTF